jgi:hypothetical protein
VAARKNEEPRNQWIGHSHLGADSIAALQKKAITIVLHDPTGLTCLPVTGLFTGPIKTAVSDRLAANSIFVDSDGGTATVQMSGPGTVKYHLIASCANSDPTQQPWNTDLHGSEDTDLSLV